jgi:hypothetical protein
MSRLYPTNNNKNTMRRGTHERRRAVRRRRKGLSTLEVVMTAGVMLPITAFLISMGVLFLRVLYTVIGTMIGSPAM